MKYVVVECDGCGKNLTTEKFYHELSLHFNTWVNDPNTGQREIEGSMDRGSRSLYCEGCFNRLVGHIEAFTKEEL